MVFGGRLGDLFGMRRVLGLLRGAGAGRGWGADAIDWRLAFLIDQPGDRDQGLGVPPGKLIIEAEQKGIEHLPDTGLPHIIKPGVIASHITAFQATFAVSAGIALPGAIFSLILVRKTDRVKVGGFARRSRWVAASQRRSPAITRRPGGSIDGPATRRDRLARLSPTAVVEMVGMRPQTRSRIADGLERAHLLRPAERLREEWLTHRVDERLACGPDGMPLPPPRLRLLVDGRCADGGHFLRVGRQMFEGIRGGVAAMGREPEELGAVLDFGCGCGRVARHWGSRRGPEVHGCDYNQALVDWCAANLCHLRVARNDLAPPLSHVSGSFDLIYALSVFTHLDAELQRAWLEEYRRLLAPGGLFVVSVLGATVAPRLGDEERRRFEAGEMVVQRPRMAGRNLCTVYHPRAYVERTLLAGFEDVQTFELGSPDLPIWQTGYIARRG